MNYYIIRGDLVSNTMKQCLNCKPGEKINEGYDQFPEGKEFYDFYIDMIDPTEEQLISDNSDDSWKLNLENNICPFCKNELIDTLISPDDCHIIAEYSNYNRDFLLAMIELRKKDVIEFETKMQPFRKAVEDEDEKDLPHCPTCNSGNIERISYKKKIFGGALFGLFSSNVRKTFWCRNCGYKW